LKCVQRSALEAAREKAMLQQKSRNQQVVQTKIVAVRKINQVASIEKSPSS
jgi:hypothetical protein